MKWIIGGLHFWRNNMNLEEIQNKLKLSDIDAYIVSYGNKFIGQDVLLTEHKIFSLCGFDGSAGAMMVTKNEVYLFVDGRYELQAKRQVNPNIITVINKVPRIKNICDEALKYNIKKIGYDAWNYAVSEMDFIKRKYKEINFVDVGDWVNVSTNKNIDVLIRDVKYSGMTREEKCKIVANMLWEQQADYFLFTSADSVSWLLNLYAKDLEFSPVVRAYALVSLKGEAILFGNLNVDGIECKSFDSLNETLNKLIGCRVLYDAHFTPEKIKLLIDDDIIFEKSPDIVQIMKAEKNETELQGMINCHIRDGVALVKFLCWLDDNFKGKNELDIVKMLHEYRQQQELFFSESFGTIAGAGGNGAIVHYHPTENNFGLLQEDNLLLIDSGAQYLDGTTDVTRTVVIGEPNKEMINDFTCVLKAHISLAKSRFPVNISGSILDVLARVNIWNNCLNYNHGTGHGVACFGNVHEGPISISPNASQYGLKPNMVLSIEPGIYKEDKYGIRIENLVYTSKVDSGNNDNEFLEFKYLTKVPIDKKLIDKYLLNMDELAWLNEYHKNVYETLAPLLNKTEQCWLEKACSPL